jgi:folate-binding protein YgfZ
MMLESDDPGVLATGAAIVDVGALEVVRATGGDRVAFLQRLLTGKVDTLAVGEGSHNLLLTLKGHVVVELRVFLRGDDVLLVAPPGQGAAAAAALSRYAIMDDFAAVLEPASRPIGVYGAEAAARLGDAGVSPPPLVPWAHADVASAAGPLWVVRAPAYGADGFWVWGEMGAIDALAGRLAATGVPRLREDVVEALRVLAGEPKFGVEITDDYFPMEVGLSGAIDYGKGCYLGQEPIVRIRDRGHVNWRLVGLRLRDDTAVAPGDRLESEAKPKAGKLTSVARMPGGLPVALGLLHVSVPAGAEVQVHRADGTMARAEVVALADSA